MIPVPRHPVSEEREDCHGMVSVMPGMLPNLDPHVEWLSLLPVPVARRLAREEEA